MLCVGTYSSEQWHNLPSTFPVAEEKPAADPRLTHSPTSRCSKNLCRMRKYTDDLTHRTGTLCRASIICPLCVFIYHGCGLPLLQKHWNWEFSDCVRAKILNQNWHHSPSMKKTGDTIGPAQILTPKYNFLHLVELHWSNKDLRKWAIKWVKASGNSKCGTTSHVSTMISSI